MSRPAAPVVTKMLPESAHDLTLDEWCAAFEKPFLRSDVKIRSRVPEVITRDRRRARRKGLPESEEILTYSFSREGRFGMFSAMSCEVSAYWEGGWDPKRFAEQLIWRWGGKPLNAEGTSA